jgi:HPt (histidine-containing phosphotransfer) domain-containing protein
MSFSLEGLPWMPSPPLVPDREPAEPVIDRAHLGRMTFGDQDLEREVLAMFAAQASQLMDRLTQIPSDAAILVHTLKGAARAIGAVRVSDAAEALEAVLGSGGATAGLVAALTDAVAETRDAIDILLRRS